MLLKFQKIRKVDIAQIFRVYRESIDREYRDSKDCNCPEEAFYEDLRHFFSVSGAILGVWCADGVYMASLRLEPYRDGYLISCLETAPNCRRRGYASMLLSQLMEQFPGSYYAHIDKKNRPSLLLHAKLGFEVISDHAVYVDGSVFTSSYTLKKC
ncbi:MAG: GNAT family N-acetyltransferase [Oscillospiraceae bacterium]|nr:GNAT family N-acetyltransferase [Oscillospiraceae bacterium]